LLDLRRDDPVTPEDVCGAHRPGTTVQLRDGHRRKGVPLREEDRSTDGSGERAADRGVDEGERLTARDDDRVRGDGDLGSDGDGRRIPVRAAEALLLARDVGAVEAE